MNPKWRTFVRIRRVNAVKIQALTGKQRNVAPFVKAVARDVAADGRRANSCAR